MLVRKCQLEKIEDPNFKYLTTAKFSKFSGINGGFLYRIKNNQVKISESLYLKIMSYLTKFVSMLQ